MNGTPHSVLVNGGLASLLRRQKLLAQAIRVRLRCGWVELARPWAVMVSRAFLPASRRVVDAMRQRWPEVQMTAALKPAILHQSS